MKSNKKLFAILTLVMFMMTLVPALAFGAINNDATKVSYDKTTVEADGTAYAKITIYTNEVAGGLVTPLSNVAVYVASSRVGSDIFTDKDGNALVADADEARVFTSPVSDGTGKIEIRVKSSVAGTPNIAIGSVNPTGNNTTSVFNYLDGLSNTTASTVGLINKTQVTFTAAAVKDVIALTVVDKSGAVDPGNDNMIANGLDYYEITFMVRDAARAGVPDQTVSFSADKTSATFNATSKATDAQGLAKVKVYGTKAEAVIVKATVGSKSVEQTVTYQAGDPFDIKLVSTDKQTVAYEQTAKEFDFQVTDVQGNKYTTDLTKVDFELVTKPTDASSTITESFDADKYYQLSLASFNKEGDYVLRAKLDNGKYADISFTVKKQGDIVGLKLVYKEATLALGATSKKPTVTRLDAAGVGLDVTLPDSVTFYTSDNKIVTAISNLGVLTASTDKNYIGDVVITAIDSSNKLTATASLKVGHYIQTLALSAPATASVGTSAAVTVKTVDRNGVVVAMGDTAAAAATYYVVTKPEGAVVSVESASKFVDNMKQKGEAAFNVNSNKAGKVTVQMVLDTYTATVDVNFGAAAAQAIGAKAVTLFIGATGYVQDGVAKVSDVAPFIKDGRTFVAVRPLAEAFGATAAWNEATQTVTLTRSDMTLTIVIGKAEITKVAGGVTSTIKADVAAFIKDGRTVLPFRAVGEAFGATVNYDAATQAVSFAQ